MELLPLIALALALWALRRTHDHERLRKRVDALEAQLVAARGAGMAPLSTAAPSEIPPPLAPGPTGAREAPEDVAPGLESGDVELEPPPSDVASPPASPAPLLGGQVD